MSLAHFVFMCFTHLTS